MKRKIIGLLAIFALLPFSRSFAQDGEIIVTDFEPDLSMVCRGNTPLGEIELDVDGDGTTDFRYYYENIREITCKCKPSAGWEWRRNNSANIWFNYAKSVETPSGSLSVPWTMKEEYFYRKAVGNQYCYGWVRLYCVVADTFYLSQFPDPLFEYIVYVDKMAYCTIPDYPLQWGQTELNTSVDENSEGVFAVYPNPAKQSVTLIGQQIAEASLFSITGQLVATKPGNGTESLTVDVSGLPSGLYFVTAIGKDGRKCVQKVVKQ